ncbi:hypothetical protein ACFLVW_02885 [Chloroflexota bacterium]
MPIESLKTIAKDCLQSRLITLSTRKLKEVEAAIHFTLGDEAR